MSKRSKICKKVLSLLEHTRVGLPIIQNGKLVGAVTHVMINNPTEGYGIFIENMLSAENDTATSKAA